jgi:hypothetical protein
MSDSVHFHWQNLNDKPAGRTGSPLRHGRAWLRILGGSINWEWLLGRIDLGFRFAARQDEGLGFGFRFSVPLLTLYFSIDSFRPVAALARWLLRNAGCEDREISWSVHDWAIWWSVWRDSSSWSSTVPYWRSGSFHIDDFVLGKAKYSSRVLSEQAVKIAMPEGSYDATVKIEERSWKRPRWFVRRIVGADVKIPAGIPFPGKGENSWDCGQDAVYGQSNQASTVEGAVAAVVESVLRSRRRYGGSVDWAPQSVVT